jgi:hypothetical protein
MIISLSEAPTTWKSLIISGDVGRNEAYFKALRFVVRGGINLVVKSNDNFHLPDRSHYFLQLLPAFLLQSCGLVTDLMVLNFNIRLRTVEGEVIKFEITSLGCFPF